MKIIIICLIFLVTIGCSSTHEFYVSVNGSDSNNGSKDKPFKTIQSAANTALPGDVIVVTTTIESPPQGGSDSGGPGNGDSGEATDGSTDGDSDGDSGDSGDGGGGDGGGDGGGGGGGGAM